MKLIIKNSKFILGCLPLVRVYDKCLRHSVFREDFNSTVGALYDRLYFQSDRGVLSRKTAKFPKKKRKKLRHTHVVPFFPIVCHKYFNVAVFQIRRQIYFLIKLVVTRFRPTRVVALGTSKTRGHRTWPSHTLTYHNELRVNAHVIFILSIVIYVRTDFANRNYWGNTTFRPHLKVISVPITVIREQCKLITYQCKQHKITRAT